MVHNPPPLFSMNPVYSRSYHYKVLFFFTGNAVWEDPTSAHRALYGKGEYPVIAEKDKDKIQEELFTPVWRLGVPHPRSKQLLLRVATTLDTKNRGAANRSQYYRKYGNPNSSDWPTEHETFQEDLR